MTDGERLWTGIALSLFLHFSLALLHVSPAEEAPAFRAVLEMDEESTLTRGGTRPGTGLQSSSPEDREEAEELNRKRRAYLRYLDEVDDAIHARRLDSGDTSLIGAKYASSIPRAERRWTPRPCGPCVLQAASCAGRKFWAPPPSMFPFR